MSRGFLSRLKPSGGFVVVFTSSALAGGAYRYFTSRQNEDGGESLNPSTFSPYALLSKQAVTQTSSIFTLRQSDHGGEDGVVKSAAAIREIWRRGIWSVQAKQPELQIARSYTPLPPTSSSSSHQEHLPSSTEEESKVEYDPDLRFLVRAEQNGEMSTYLHSLQPSAEIDLRGPFFELELPDDLREVIFVAGGTGIAPALQVAYILSQRPGARMRILWNTRHREECRGGQSDVRGREGEGGSPSKSKLEQLDPWGKISQWTTWGLAAGGQKPESALEESRRLSAVTDGEKGLIVRELEALKSRFRATRQNSREKRGGLSIEYFVDDDNRFVKPRDISRQLRLVADDEAESALPPGKKLILVSGPDGFISLWAGKKVWMGGKETQGPLGGYLGNLGLTRQGWRVWKL